jgi:tRNA threonylcarbamoyladenosine biosynthesis protein TsaB
MKSERISPVAREQYGSEAEGTELLLGIDTCGPTGSVALGRLAEGMVEILEQIELEGRSYSATLVAAVGDLLAHAGVQLGELGAIIAVNGPGSFTGVRVGLSAVKGLAESARIPVIPVSRLEVLAWKAGCVASALDAHRNEVFLRAQGRDGKGIEMLAGRSELLMMLPPAHIAVCDELAAVLLETAWPQSKLLDVPAPTAAEALRLALPRILAGEIVDLALLDGHYLRRSDAEIFGEAASGSAARTQGA